MGISSLYWQIIFPVYFRSVPVANHVICLECHDVGKIPELETGDYYC